MLYEEDIMGTFSKTHQMDSIPGVEAPFNPRLASTGKNFNQAQQAQLEDAGSFRSPMSKLGSDISFPASYPSNRNDLKMKMRFNNDREAQKREREAQQQKFMSENFELRESIKAAFASDKSKNLMNGRRRPFEEPESSSNSSLD